MWVPVLITAAVLGGLALSSVKTQGGPGPDPDNGPPPPPPPPPDDELKVGDQVIVDVAKTAVGLQTIVPASGLALVTVDSFLPPGAPPGEPRFNATLNGYFTGRAVTRATYTQVPPPGVPIPGLPVSSIAFVDPVF